MAPATNFINIADPAAVDEAGNMAPVSGDVADNVADMSAAGESQADSTVAIVLGVLGLAVAAVVICCVLRYCCKCCGPTTPAATVPTATVPTAATAGGAKASRATDVATGLCAALCCYAACSDCGDHICEDLGDCTEAFCSCLGETCQVCLSPCSGGDGCGEVCDGCDCGDGCDCDGCDAGDCAGDCDC
jgi:hypothetical protein